MYNIDHIPVSGVMNKILSKSISGWKDFEVETLILELDIEPSELAVDKISVCKVLADSPELFYEDALFFLHVVNVFNNLPSNFDIVPEPNSLQIAFAIIDMGKVLDEIGEQTVTFTPDSDVKNVIEKILREEGYSDIIPPFPEGINLIAGQSKEDTRDKEMAIKMYVKSMYK